MTTTNKNWHLKNTPCVWRIVISILHPHTYRWRYVVLLSHFTKEETEPERSCVICPKSFS